MKFSELAIPIGMRMDHASKGGKQLRRWVSFIRLNPLKDGMGRGEVIRVMHGYEPVGGGKYEHHVSISIALDGGVETPAIRPVTDAEVAAVKQFLKVEKWTDETNGSDVKHFWY